MRDQGGTGAAPPALDLQSFGLLPSKQDQVYQSTRQAEKKPQGKCRGQQQMEGTACSDCLNPLPCMLGKESGAVSSPRIPQPLPKNAPEFGSTDLRLS